MIRLFLTDPLLLKASHYKRITVPGHVHSGKWVDPYSKNVLVSDDHDTDKVASGQGSFYQKQAHKKLADKVEGFSTMNPDAKASIIMAHATKMQGEASASAAVSGFKASMLAGKVPTPAQYLAMQNASTKAQGDVADACAAVIGPDKYEQLLMAASAKANQPKGKTSESQANQAVQAKPQAPAASQTADLPPSIKAKLDGWAEDGYVDRLKDAASDSSLDAAITDHAKKLLVQFLPPDVGPTESTPLPGNIKAVIDKIASVPTGDVKGAKLLLGQIVMNNSHNPHIAAYANSKLAEFKALDEDFVTLKDWPGTKYKLNAGGQWEGHDSVSGFHAVQGPELSAALFIKQGAPVPADVVSKLSDKSKAAIVKDAAAEFGMSAMDVQALLTANEKTGPKEGDTKPGANGSNLVFKNGRWHKYVDADESGEVPPVLVPVEDDTANHAAAVAAMETGAFYQKEAIKKLKTEHGAAWAAMHPSKQHELAHAKYQALQGAASQAAAVSGWKKHMLAGQVPTPSEVKAFAAMANEDSAKAGKMLAEVQTAIGGDKLAVLVSQAHAKAVKAGSFVSTGNVGMAPAAPSKVFVTTPPIAATLADKPAYDHLAQSIANHKGHSLPAQKTFSKLAAQDWMAANPGKGAEMYEALAAHKLSHLAAMVGPDVKPGPGAAPAPVNEAAAKFKNNWPVKEFIATFKLHGGPVAQGMSIDEMLEPDEIAAFNKLTPDEKNDVAAAISFYGPHKLKLFMDWVSAQNAKKAAPVGSVPVTSSVYTNTQPGHNKFWSVSVHGSQMKTTYGKLGTQGSTTTKDFASSDHAQMAAAKLKNEKMGKGYKYGYTGVHQYEGAAPSVYAAPAAVPPPKFDVVSGGWVHQVSDGALSGAPSLTQETKDGHTYFVAYTDDKTFQVGIIDDQGNPIEHEDFPYAEDAAAQMALYIDGNNAEIPHPSADDVQALNPASGPKDGDTKMAMDGGTLVFKNGRWHKQGLVMPDFSDDKSVWGPRYADVAAKLQELFAAGGAKAIKPYIINHASGAISVKSGLVAGVGKLSMLSGASVKPRHNKMHAFVTAMQAAGKGGKKAVFTTGSNPAPAAPKPAQAASSPKVFVTAPPAKPGVTVIDGWAQTGPQTGSNPGGKFKDKNGVEWYCKFPADKNVAMNEILAAKFYEMLGVAVPNLKLVEKGGKTGIASKWVDGMSKATAAKLAKAKGVHEAFAIDAWLANWDVVGLSNDNLMLDKSGAAVHVDVGGSLVYRAQGGKKGDDFGDTVPELETLKDPKKNDKSAAVFASATPDSMEWGLRQLNKMKPSQITELCEKLGPGSTAEKSALAAKLIARREFILKEFGIQDQWTIVHKLDPANLPVNPADLPKPIQFTASSKAHVNAQNTKDSEALIAFASKGNLTALKDYLYDAVDKETSAPLGKKSILDHPSKPLKEQWAGLVELLQSISTPPMPTLSLPSLGSVGELGDISDFVGFFNPQERVETVAAEHRMHFFMALSHIDDISGLVAGMKWSFLKAGGKFVQEAKAKHSSLSSAVRGYISAVQSSGSINHSWSQGKTVVQSGGKSVGIHGLTAKIYAEAQELPEGTTLIRGMTDTSSGKSMCKQLMACAPGTVLQNTDSMCASYNDGHSWGGDVQMTIRCAKGCKATLSFASGSFSGEHEITTLPGQRYVVLSTKKVNGTVHLEVLMLPPHEGYVSELGKLYALGKAMTVIFTRGL